MDFEPIAFNVISIIIDVYLALSISYIIRLIKGLPYMIKHLL
jgi:uncharacterized membrane protein